MEVGLGDGAVGLGVGSHGNPGWGTMGPAAGLLSLTGLTEGTWREKIYYTGTLSN